MSRIHLPPFKDAAAVPLRIIGALVLALLLQRRGRGLTTAQKLLLGMVLTTVAQIGRAHV